MSLHQDILGLIDPRGKSSRAAVIWMKLFHQRPVSVDDFRRARPVLETKHLKGLSVAEISQLMDRSETAVGGLLRRGMKKLRNQLRDQE